MAVLHRRSTCATTSTTRTTPHNDRLVFSKGHASTLLYAMYRAAGAISDEELLTYRQFDSHLRGPSDAADPVGRRRDRLARTGPAVRRSVWRSPASGSTGCRSASGCSVGDSEMAEGSQWEAIRARRALRARQPRRDPRRQPARPARRDDARLGSRLATRAARARSAGTRSRSTATTSRRSTAPTPRRSTTADSLSAIVAQTIKGKGVKAVEDKPGWHGKALDHPEEAIDELGGIRNIVVDVAKPETGGSHASSSRAATLELPRYELGDEVATRKAYGDALAALGKARGDVVALDGEVSNSTFAEELPRRDPERYFEMYIAEQQLVATAVGMQVPGWRPFASTFAAFISRAYDFVRMSAISRANYCLCGLARRRLDRRGRALADGARGHRRVARRSRLDRAASLRREPDRRSSSRRWPTPTESSYLRTLRAEHAGASTDADDEFEIGGSRTRARGRRRRADRRGDHRARGARRRPTTLAAGGHRGAGDRPLLDQAARRGDARARWPRARSSRSEDHWAEGGLGEAVLPALGDSGRAAAGRAGSP